MGEVGIKEYSTMCESLACISEGTILGLKAKLANLKFKTTKQGTHQSKIQKKSKQNILQKISKHQKIFWTEYQDIQKHLD